MAERTRRALIWVGVTFAVLAVATVFLVAMPGTAPGETTSEEQQDVP